MGVDRLEEIKAGLANEKGPGGRPRRSRLSIDGCIDDIEWLVAEVERLRERDQGWIQFAKLAYAKEAQ